MRRKRSHLGPRRRKAAAPSRACAEFMSQAYAMEVDAAQRYTDFADQMEVHNNPEVAGLFRKLAEIEGKHAKSILAEMGWPAMPEPVYALQWATPEPPETAPVTELHYRMQPWHALEVALRAERRAVAFFEGIAQGAGTPPEVKKLAAEMAGEEREHVRLIEQWMLRVPRPEPDWSRDPDPPVYSD
jgi:rubrerythrin